MQPIACSEKPINLQENEKQLLQLSTNQLTAGSTKHLYRLKTPVPERLNFVISKWM